MNDNNLNAFVVTEIEVFVRKIEAEQGGHVGTMLHRLRVREVDDPRRGHGALLQKQVLMIVEVQSASVWSLTITLRREEMRVESLRHPEE